MRDGYLCKGKLLPSWYTRPEVADILTHAHPPRGQGSAFGSPDCRALASRRSLRFSRTGSTSMGERSPSSTATSSGRTCPRAWGSATRIAKSRTQIGFVASEIVRHEGVVPALRSVRIAPPGIRSGPSSRGLHRGFREHADRRVLDPRRERPVRPRGRAELKGFTGIDDPYQPPIQAEIEIQTVKQTAEDATLSILEYLKKSSFLPAPIEPRTRSRR